MQVGKAASRHALRRHHWRLAQKSFIVTLFLVRELCVCACVRVGVWGVRCEICVPCVSVCLCLCLCGGCACVCEVLCVCLFVFV